MADNQQAATKCSKAMQQPPRMYSGSATGGGNSEVVAGGEELNGWVWGEAVLGVATLIFIWNSTQLNLSLACPIQSDFELPAASVPGVVVDMIRHPK